MSTIPKTVEKRIRENIKKYKKVLKSAKNRDVNEQDTVTILTDMLADICGYDKYTEITREIAEEPDEDGNPKHVVTKKISKFARGNVTAQQFILSNLNPKRWKVIRHQKTDVKVGLIEPKKAMESRQEEFVDAEFEEVEPKQIEGKTDDENKN